MYYLQRYATHNTSVDQVAKISQKKQQQQSDRTRQIPVSACSEKKKKTTEGEKTTKQSATVD